MNFEETLMSFAVAAAAGGLIGAEREQAQADHDTRDFGGVRTFPLLALLGALGATLVPAVGGWLLAACFASAAVLLAISHARAKQGDVGVSSEISAIITFSLGALAASPGLMPQGQRYLLVAATSALTMALLALKRPLHGFIAKVSKDDIYATTKFVLLALVLIPILPNRTYGPLSVLNPAKIGLMIAFVAGISFAGYVAARWIGSRRGLLVTGLIGGLVSSTAVTVTLAIRTKEEPALARTCTVAILAACSTMFARMLAIVAVVYAPLLTKLFATLGSMAILGYVLSAVLYRREKHAQASRNEEIPLRNPFELKRALQFGAFYALILLVAKAAQTYAGNTGIYASAVFAGLTDVDAITLSLAELQRSGMSGNVAALAITLAAITNTLVKGGIAAVLGGPQLGKRVILALSAVLVGGGVVGAIQAMIIT